MEYIRDNYQLVLLSEEETKTLNRKNRTRIVKDRLADAGITLFSEKNEIDVSS